MSDRRPIPFRNDKLGQLAYFDVQLDHPDWWNARVLDFGGSNGNLLRDDQQRLPVAHYCCLDVSRAAIEDGRRRHPGARFVHYDRYNNEYNPDGHPRRPIPDLGRFDIIVAYSVFTHVPRSELLEFTARLRALLAPGGILAFSFLAPWWDPSLDPNYRRPDVGLGALAGSNLKVRLSRNRAVMPREVVTDTDSQQHLAPARRARWCSLLDERLLIETHEWPTDVRSGCINNQFYTVEHMEELFPNARVKSPVPPERQHCCILGALDG